MSAKRVCLGCGLPAGGFRTGIVLNERAYTGLACRICLRMNSWKWESAIDEWKRILRAERDEERAKKRSV